MRLLLLLLTTAALACAPAPSADDATETADAASTDNPAQMGTQTPGDAQAERQHIRLPTRSVDAPFSDAVQVGNTLYLAGQIALDPETGRPPADAATEARQVLGIIRSVLEQAGMTMNDLVSVQVFCSDVSLYDVWNEVYRELVPAPYPARAFIGSGPLLFGARFEVQAIAVGR